MSTSIIEKPDTVDNDSDDDTSHALCGICHPRGELVNLPPGTIVVAVCGSEERLWTQKAMKYDARGIPVKACPICVEVAEGRWTANCGHSVKDMLSG